MSYIINKTTGAMVTEIIDGSIDQTSTDLTLIGKNATSYGEFLNENLVHLLENFANTSQPPYPIDGQLWFDTAERRLKVYDEYIHSFKVSGGAFVSPSAPSSISAGDFWVDTSRKQLYFNDGISTVLAGPLYSEQQGISGLQTTDVIDSNLNNHTVVLLYVATALLGIFSKDAFTPKVAIPGFTGDILVGFNSGNYSSMKLHSNASSADALVDPTDGSLKTAMAFVTTNSDSTVGGTLTMQSSVPLILGPFSNTEIQITNNSTNINSNIINQNFNIKLLNANGLLSAITILGASEHIGLYTEFPTATLDVNGSAIIRGSLTVTGEMTSINTTNLSITDKIIELGKTTIPSNTTANGGGFAVVAGADIDKTLTWDLVNHSWTSSEHFNIPAGKCYKINGTTVLTENTLAPAVTDSSLTTIGTLVALQVANINIDGSTISYLNISHTDGDVVIKPKGTGSVDINMSRLINVANPVVGTDAVTLASMMTAISNAPLAISLDATGLSNPEIVSNYLIKVFPISEHYPGTMCRVICTDAGIVTVRLFILNFGAWTFQSIL